MIKQADWCFLDVETLASTHPDFFSDFPIRTLIERSSIQTGELVKLAVRSRIENETHHYGRWVIVDQVYEPGLYAGHLMHGYKETSFPPNEKFDRLDFTEANIYRLPPRKFTLWGIEGIPIRIYGGTERPELEDGLPDPACLERIISFKACGWDHAKEQYVNMQRSNENWPNLDELFGHAK